MARLLTLWTLSWGGALRRGSRLRHGAIGGFPGAWGCACSCLSCVGWGRFRRNLFARLTHREAQATAFRVNAQDTHRHLFTLMEHLLGIGDPGG